MLILILAIATAVLALLHMHLRGRAPDEHTREIPAVRELVAAGSLTPGWNTLSGPFDISSEARRAGDLAVAELELPERLRRPVVTSGVGAAEPPPGGVSLELVHAENCDPGTLRALTSGERRCTEERLVVGVEARERGPMRARGRFVVRG